MSGRCLRGNNRSNNGEEHTECIANMPVQQFKLGAIIWCRINGKTWRPVQVVDEKCVASKPKKKKKNQILVRLYGSSEHMYVEPANCASKNEQIYGQENSTSREIFKKALVEDLSRMKSGGHFETRISESNEIEKEKAEALRGKVGIKGNLKRTMVEENSPLVVSSHIPKAAKQARNDKKGGIEAAIETPNLNIGAFTISSLDKNDSRISRENGSEKLTSNCHFSEPESNCDWNSDAYKNAQIEISDAKYIKKLVGKIVKEVAAENARNESLKDKGVESYLESAEHIEKSKKEYFVVEKPRISRRLKNKHMDLPVTGVFDDTRDKIAGQSQNTNGEGHVSNLSEQGFHCDNYEKKKETEIDALESAMIYEARVINGVHPCQETASNVCLTVLEEVKCSEIEVAVNEDQRCQVVKDASRVQMDRTGAAKCTIPEEELSPRRTRIMQNLGLVAPSGSPFRKKRSIKSSVKKL